jgi:hypothetical protein
MGGTGFQPVSENTTGKMPVPHKTAVPACSVYSFAVPYGAIHERHFDTRGPDSSRQLGVESVLFAVHRAVEQFR